MPPTRGVAAHRLRTVAVTPRLSVGQGVRSHLELFVSLEHQ